MRWTGLLALAVAAIVASTAAAAVGRTRPGPAVTVSPATGTAQTRFVVSFVAPGQTGPVGDRRYVIAASGVSGGGCDSTPAGDAAPAARARMVHVALVPSGEGWCSGTYHGAVDEIAMPACRARMVCPLYIVVVRRIGSFSFRVR